MLKNIFSSVPQFKIRKCNHIGFSKKKKRQVIFKISSVSMTRKKILLLKMTLS